MIIVNTKDKLIGCICNRSTAYTTKMQIMHQISASDRAVESLRGLAVKKGDTVYILKCRNRLNSFDDFESLPWETVSIKEFNSGVTPNGVNTEFYQNKCFIVDITEEENTNGSC